jgi:hypothetical protein
MLLQTKALSGGRTFSTFVTNLEGLPNARLEMALLFFFGWTSGMTSSTRRFQDYSHLQRIKRSQWLTFSQQQIWLHTFTYHYQNKLTKNTMNCRKLFRAFRLDRKTKINGNISRCLENIQPTVTTNIFTKRCNHQNLSYGFGAPDVATN